MWERIFAAALMSGLLLKAYRQEQVISALREEIRFLQPVVPEEW